MAVILKTKPFNSDSKPSLDFPPYSRLWIKSSKELVEEDFRNAFSKFGEIVQVEVKKDSRGEQIGVTYIKYTKPSEAAAALETMNGNVIGIYPLKVMLSPIAKLDFKSFGVEVEETLRLHVKIPKTITDNQLYNIFKVYGDINYVIIIRDIETRESKGFAYVKYFKFSHAAAAYENCDGKFEAVFADFDKALGLARNMRLPVYYVIEN